VLLLWRIAIFRTGFPSGWIDGDVFSWKVAARLAQRNSHIGAQARANASRLLIGLGLYGIVLAAAILTLV
jgi:hypothetical protein